MSDLMKRYRKLMREADRLPWGRQELAVVLQAVATAAELGDLDLEFTARGRANSSAAMAGDTETLLTCFAWCLARHDEDPVRFPLGIGVGEDLLWQYKWVLPRLCASPVFSLSQIEAALADMERRYSAAGLGRSGVLVTRFLTLWRLGRLDEAGQVRAELVATPRDSHSDCEACVHSVNLEYLAATGADAEAIRVLETMLSGDSSCAEEPERALSFALLPALRQGRFDEARRWHRRGYPAAAEHEDGIEMVAGHLQFLTLTGNLAEALQLVERHLAGVEHDGLDQFARLRGLAAVAQACDAITAAGHGDQPLAAASDPRLAAVFPGKPDGWSVAEVAAAAWVCAVEVAAALDARNGNDHHSQTLRVRQAATERYDLPLQVRAFDVGPLAQQPSDPAAQLRLARDLVRVGQARDALEVTGRLGEAEPSTAAAVAWVNALAWHTLGDLDRAEAALSRRVASLRTSGAVTDADILERLGLSVLGDSEADEMSLRAEIERCDPHPSDLLAELHNWHGSVLLGLGRPDEAGMACLTAESIARQVGATSLAAAALGGRLMAAVEAGADGEVERLAELLSVEEENNAGRWFALTVLARIAAGRHGPAAGAERADGAVRFAQESGLRVPAERAARLAGDLWLEAGAPRLAAARYRFAWQSAERAEQAEASLAWSWGHALVQAGESAQAIEVLSQIRDEGPLKAHVQAWLARAYEDEEDFDAAGEAWDTARELFTELQEFDEAAFAALREGRLARLEGVDEIALRLFDEAVRVGRLGETSGRTIFDALTAKATTLADTEDAEALEVVTDIVRLAEALGEAWLVADATDTHARVLARLGRPADAIPLALQAADSYRAADDAAAAGGAEYFAGRLLFETDRGAQAVGVLRSALDAPERQPGYADAVRVLLADALDAAGESQEAADLRRLVEGSGS